MIRVVPAVAAMASYALADLGDSSAVSLAQNESAFPTSPKAIAAGEAALASATLYPDPDWRTLRAAIGSAHGLDAEHILCGAGSMELIGCLIRAFAGPGDDVLGTAYGYLFVGTACQQSGARYVKAAEPELTVSVDLLLAAVTPATRIVFLCNPGNPTGTRIANTEVLRLRKGLPAEVLLVVDQAYGEFDDQDPTPIFDLVARGDTVVLRTFSKAYGLASARVGWGYFPPRISAESRKLLNPNNISSFSQAMANAAMRDQAHMAQVVDQTAQIRDRFSSRLRQAGLHVPTSHTNFVLIRFPDAHAAKQADAALRKAGYILRAMGGYGLPECLRGTVGAADVMDAVAGILENLKAEKHDQ
jgi:histidinol-phosphate aminotransferase